MREMGEALAEDLSNLIAEMLEFISYLFEKIFDDEALYTNSGNQKSLLGILFRFIIWLFLVLLSISMSILLVATFIIGFPLLHQYLRRLLITEADIENEVMNAHFPQSKHRRNRYNYVALGVAVIVIGVGVLYVTNLFPQIKSQLEQLFNEKVTIESIKFKGDNDSGQNGMKIDFYVQGSALKDCKCRIIAYFSDNSDKPLKTQNRNYSDMDGNVAVGKDLTSGSTNQSISLFLPYNAISTIPGKYSLKFEVKVFDEKKKEFISESYEQFFQLTIP
ncbi:MULTISPECIES: hypothetical protein [Calothrix]|nr:hypothetical protein [Calothrix anomala]MBD2228886.1 hypothetical protein [Calothrix anomala FACHB-343]